eukprot:5210441-Pyramimonas_sp.AAC.1
MLPCDCLICGAERGTLFHRHFSCPARLAWRREFLPEELKKAAEQVAGILRGSAGEACQGHPPRP